MNTQSTDAVIGPSYDTVMGAIEELYEWHQELLLSEEYLECFGTEEEKQDYAVSRASLNRQVDQVNRILHPLSVF